MTAQISDETLCAYIDGELDAGERARVEAALADDPEIAARIESLRRADSAIEAAFDPAALGPVPRHLTDLVEQASTSSPATVIPFRRAAVTSAWRLPLAAGFALIVGAAGFAAGRAGEGGAPAIIAALASDRSVTKALDTTPSAQTHAFASGGSLRPVLTFRAADGRFCREFELEGGDAAALGVACRRDQRWETEVLVAASARGDGYGTVSGPAAMDAVAVALNAGPALSEEEERAAMAAGWRPPQR
jgi:anti-sigma factor RsiW